MDKIYTKSDFKVIKISDIQGENKDVAVGYYCGDDYDYAIIDIASFETDKNDILEGFMSLPALLVGNDKKALENQLDTLVFMSNEMWTTDCGYWQCKSDTSYDSDRYVHVLVDSAEFVRDGEIWPYGETSLSEAIELYFTAE